MDNLFLKEEQFEKIFKSHLKIETYSKSIESLFSERLLNKINYKPYYQRNYVWDPDKATYFLESIFLGTEIPPMIFFKNDDNVEVIDGRQRFETISKFKNNELQLTDKGLYSLKQLKKKTYEGLSDEPGNIIDLFLDAKLRIIEFEIVNEPKLDPNLEDKIKKEIFSRYNSGITPLRKSEIENAEYITDPISDYFKSELKENIDLMKKIYSIFFPHQDQEAPKLDKVIQFIRRHLVLPNIPLKYYARGTRRTELITKYYEYFQDQYIDADDEIKSLYVAFEKKIIIINRIKNAFETQGYNSNRLLFECLLWVLFVLEKEEENIEEYFNAKKILELVSFINKHISSYTEVSHHYYSTVMERYKTTAQFFEKDMGLQLNIYTEGSTNPFKKIKDKEAENPTTHLENLETLRITKPDPSRNSIDDIIRQMERKKFVVRPPYQRKEVINVPKSSAIIESMLLGIMLPAIFIYKREDGISEVVDGQQRLLTILGFIGKEYVDEGGKRKASKNHKFSLRKIKILHELNGKKYDDLEPALKDRILDFELFVVEIEERLNKEFNPVDLFIRLNDKPYPIKENSFEMWNSWADKDIITCIRQIWQNNIDWFYFRSPKNKHFRDRMQNEELITRLAYFDYRSRDTDADFIYLDVYPKNERISSRIRNIKDVTAVLTKASEDEEVKREFIASIKNVESFLFKLKLVFNSEDSGILEGGINEIFKAGKNKSRPRTLQDFYFLWELLNSVNGNMLKEKREKILKDINEIFHFIKNIPQETKKPLEVYNKKLSQFSNNYSKENLLF